MKLSVVLSRSPSCPVSFYSWYEALLLTFLAAGLPLCCSTAKLCSVTIVPLVVYVDVTMVLCVLHFDGGGVFLFELGTTCSWFAWSGRVCPIKVACLRREGGGAICSYDHTAIVLCAQLYAQAEEDKYNDVKFSILFFRREGSEHRTIVFLNFCWVCFKD